MLGEFRSPDTRSGGVVWKTTWAAILRQSEPETSEEERLSEREGRRMPDRWRDEGKDERM